MEEVRSESEHMMLEQMRLATNLKYPWQQAVRDALLEDEPERLPGKIADAERAVSARLIQEVADPHERLALRGAVIALECVRHPNYVDLTDSKQKTAKD